MVTPIKIGTRDSALALWQAHRAQDMLQEHGFLAEIVEVKSDGDLDLVTPLYEMGVQGIFTRNLDMALLQNKIDIAVHSMKDVPTALPAGLRKAAVLERGNYHDMLVPRITEDSWGNDLFGALPAHSVNENIITHVIATSSIRRRAQWLSRYPHALMENIRGNVNTRLQKLLDSQWDAAIFAAAGLERIGLVPVGSKEITWMLPAPAQGAIMVMCRENDEATIAACAMLNHLHTDACTGVEKDFLRILMGGCTTPISALAVTDGKEVYAQASIFSVDGKRQARSSKTVSIEECGLLGALLAEEIFAAGGREIAAELQTEARENKNI